MNPIVRSATSTDIPELARLDAHTFGSSAYSLSTVRQLLDVFGGLVVLSQDADGVPRGYAFGALAAGAETSWILALGVERSHRRQGFGRATADALLGRVGALGAERVRLTCAPEARASRAFWTSLGFVEVEHVADYLGPGRDRLVLERGFRSRG